MHDPTASVSKEVSALLREAAEESGSALRSAQPNRSPRHPLGTPLGQPVPWSRVERHLIQRHASEFAFLLRSQWLLKLSNAGRDSYRLFVRRGVDQPVVVPDSRELERSWADWRSSAEGACALHPPEPDLDACRLARLSLDIEPSPQRWVDLALSLLSIGDRAQAGALLARAWRLRPDHRIASCILTNQGLLLSMQGRDEQALAAYREAARLWPDHLSALVSRLVLSISCDAAEEAQEAAQRLNEVAPEKSAGVHEQVEYCRRLILDGSMVPDERMRIMAARVADRVGGAAGRISNVLA